MISMKMVVKVFSSNGEAFNTSSENQPDIVKSNQTKTKVEDILGGFSLQPPTPSITIEEGDAQKEENIDFLNMDNSPQERHLQNVALGINLLDLGGRAEKEQSNFDLLSGTVGSDLISGSTSAPMSSASSSADLFGGFTTFPDTKLQHSSEKNSDVFDSFQKSDSEFLDFKTFSTPQTAKNDSKHTKAQAFIDSDTITNSLLDTGKQSNLLNEDLMNNWNSSNIPRNNSFTSIPRNDNSGPSLAGMSGFNSNSNPNIQGSQLQQAKLLDPFADLSKCIFSLLSFTTHLF